MYVNHFVKYLLIVSTQRKVPLLISGHIYIFVVKIEKFGLCYFDSYLVPKELIKKFLVEGL